MQSRKPTAGGGDQTPLSYPVGVKELDGPQDVELAGHEELDGHIPGERGHIVLARPLVDLLQKLLGCLWERRGVRSEMGWEEEETPEEHPWSRSSVRGQGPSMARQTQQLLGAKQGPLRQGQGKGVKAVGMEMEGTPVWGREQVVGVLALEKRP